ncbi:MAG: hypothetical protein GTN40_05345 [Candidatus Aenigmarchaeota archaeon]|nr:hypothetical protein [Candidatus Aenigmarchaeota archaeon]
MPKEKKLPDKLIVTPWPLRVGYADQEMNRLAIEYNSLDPSDPRREEIFEKYKNSVSEARWD